MTPSAFGASGGAVTGAKPLSSGDDRGPSAAGSTVPATTPSGAGSTVPATTPSASAASSSGINGGGPAVGVGTGEGAVLGGEGAVLSGEGAVLGGEGAVLGGEGAVLGVGAGEEFARMCARAALCGGPFAHELT